MKDFMTWERIERNMTFWVLFTFLLRVRVRKLLLLSWLRVKYKATTRQLNSDGMTPRNRWFQPGNPVHNPPGNHASSFFSFSPFSAISFIQRVRTTHSGFADYVSECVSDFLESSL